MYYAYGYTLETDRIPVCFALHLLQFAQIPLSHASDNGLDDLTVVDFVQQFFFGVNEILQKRQTLFRLSLAGGICARFLFVILLVEFLLGSVPHRPEFPVFFLRSDALILLLSLMQLPLVMPQFGIDV